MQRSFRFYHRGADVWGICTKKKIIRGLCAVNAKRLVNNTCLRSLEGESVIQEVNFDPVLENG